MSVSPNKPTLLIVTANGCGACAKFKASFYESLIANIKSENLVNLELLHMPDISATLPDDLKLKYHPQLLNYTKWFPMIILFTAESWNNFDLNLDGVVFGGQFNDGELSPIPNYKFSETVILAWISNQLKTNPLFKPKLPSTRQAKPSNGGSNANGTSNVAYKPVQTVRGSTSDERKNKSSETRLNGKLNENDKLVNGNGNKGALHTQSHAQNSGAGQVQVSQPLQLSRTKHIVKYCNYDFDD